MIMLCLQILVVAVWVVGGYIAGCILCRKVLEGDSAVADALFDQTANEYVCSTKCICVMVGLLLGPMAFLLPLLVRRKKSVKE
jgi:hypothetical protein